MDEVYLQFDSYHSYKTDQAYPNRYYTFTPTFGNVIDNESVTISYTLQYYSTWSGGTITKINFVEVWFYDAYGNLLDFENASGYASSSFNGRNGSTTVNLDQCTNEYKNTAARIEVLIETTAKINTPNGYFEREVPVGDENQKVPTFTLEHVSYVGEPSSPKVSETVSRDAVTLRWREGSAGTNNTVNGYDVQYADSTDGEAWGSWTRASGSPASGTSLTVMPPDTVGHYRKFRVRTRGTAGEEWFSEWVESENMLRRKWNAFAGWTDQTLVARSTKIRSIHLTQLQERVDQIRRYYGLGAYAFTPVTAGVTKIGLWAVLIQEIRTAIDGVSTNHEAWNALYSGKPRIENVMQLRRIIDNM